MKLFARLFEAIDRTTSTNAKVEAMAAYFSIAPPEDAAWAVYFLTGRKIKRLLTSRKLSEWALERTGIPSWLFDESYTIVGDLAETIALLLDRPGEGGGSRESTDVPLSAWVRERLLRLTVAEADEQRRLVLDWWDELSGTELFLFNKMVTGELRVGVSQTLVVRALALHAGLPNATIAHRLMGEWEPSTLFFERLTGESAGEIEASRPYPFFLASPLESPPEDLGDFADWLAEWKYDGIRAQLIRRRGDVHIWSRGEELVTDRFPELRDAAARLPDGIAIDGEILAYTDSRPLPFSTLQRRIGRQKLTPKILADAPVSLICYDLLEHLGHDIRDLPLYGRRQLLETLLASAPQRFIVSPRVEASSWAELAARRDESRARVVEGIMLKRLGSPYQIGRKRGDWWKWKIDPYTIDAVLVYAQPGHGRRANLLTDYTFAVWNDGELVPVAKAYSGLDNEEIARLDAWIRRNTVERFGPVRRVEPVHVFELAFEGIALSPRHRSGVAVRFPRISRWRTDKPAAEADTLDTIKGLIDAPRQA